MNNGLEALKELKYRGFYYTKDGIDISTFVQMRLDIIEPVLERLEELEKAYGLVVDGLYNTSEEKEKQDKILRIIKEKNVNVRGIINSPNIEYYIDHCMPRHSEEPTQEEYDLLKEWLK